MRLILLIILLSGCFNTVPEYGIVKRTCRAEDCYKAFTDACDDRPWHIILIQPNDETYAQCTKKEEGK